jgi:hypothetical protein
MVDIRCIASSSLPTQQGTEQEATSHFRAGGGAPAPPQSSRPTCFTISSRAVAPRRRPAHHCCYQHTASRRGRRTALVWHQSRQRHTRAHRRHLMCRRQYMYQVSLRRICGPNSSAVSRVRTIALPLSTSGRGVVARVTTSTGTSMRWTPRLWGKLLAPQCPRWDLGVVAWCLPHTSAWWSGRASSGPTCRRGMIGVSTPLGSYRSTPPYP